MKIRISFTKNITFLITRKIITNSSIKIFIVTSVLSYGTYAWYGFLASNKIYLDNFLLRSFSAILRAYITYKISEQPILKLKNI